MTMIYKGNADPAKMTGQPEPKQLPEGAEIAVFCAFIDGALNSCSSLKDDGWGRASALARIELACMGYNDFSKSSYSVKKLVELYKSEKEKLS